MNLKDILYAELNENKILKDVLGELVEKQVVQTIKGNGTEENPITKEMIIEYLRSSGMQLSQKNFEQASISLKNKLQSVNENGEIEIAHTEQEYINHLNEFSEEEMKTLIDICILRKLITIEERMKETQYEYDVRTINDVGGATNVEALSKMITQYAESGYRVKHIFVNELGKNTVSLGGMGVNSTVDQVVIIFERRKKIKD